MRNRLRLAFPDLIGFRAAHRQDYAPGMAPDVLHIERDELGASQGSSKPEQDERPIALPGEVVRDLPHELREQIRGQCRFLLRCAAELSSYPMEGGRPDWRDPRGCERIRSRQRAGGWSPPFLPDRTRALRQIATVSGAAGEEMSVPLAPSGEVPPVRLIGADVFPAFAHAMKSTGAQRASAKSPP